MIRVRNMPFYKDAKKLTPELDLNDFCKVYSAELVAFCSTDWNNMEIILLKTILHRNVVFVKLEHLESAERKLLHFQHFVI